MTSDQHKEMIVSEAVHASASHRGRLILVVLMLIALALISIAGVMFYTAYTAARGQAEAGTSLAQQVKEACSTRETNDKTLQGICDDASQVVEEGKQVGIPGPQGEQGEQGVPGPPPSDAQVSAAVALYCQSGACDGKDVTQSQVAAAVALYCNNRGECRGPQGEQGSTGSSGPQGPPPSDEQVASAVATYCSARNDCQGPQGPTGPAGADGKPGDTVQGGECEFTGVGILTITIQTSNGPTSFECTGNPGPPTEGITP